ncbi:MAG: pseudaminic acid synthase [Methylococcaceae bacterium]|nr:pseudaminic acid synthase [Methylococcaceae bacterium]
MTLAGRDIGADFPPYVIAEMSANHNGDIENAYKIIAMAKQAGADALKMQTYTADTLTIDSDLPDFQLTDGLWAGRSLYDLYKEAYTPWEWHKPLFDYARDLDITLFSSPFDETAVDLLEDLNAPAYKIASFEAIDLPLIKYVAQTTKPMIISTGMADLEEITEAVEIAKENGCHALVLLHCISSYPTPIEQSNLKVIVDLAERFKVPVGLSDHTLGTTAAIVGVALGASVIEKHVTLSRSEGGVDSAFSLEPEELQRLCLQTKSAWQALGDAGYEQKPAELGNVRFRRSIYVVEDIQKGERFTRKNIRIIRPGFGLKPKYFPDVLGLSANKAMFKGQPLLATDVDNDG